MYLKLLVTAFYFLLSRIDKDAPYEVKKAWQDPKERAILIFNIFAFGISLILAATACNIIYSCVTQSN